MSDEVVLESPIMEQFHKECEYEEEAIREGSNITNHIKQVVDASPDSIMIQIELVSDSSVNEIFVLIWSCIDPLEREDVMIVV